MTIEKVKVHSPSKFFIGGKWVEGNGNTIDLISPDSEEIIGQIAEAGREDMDRAVAAARDAFDNGPWPRMQPAERARIMRSIAEELAKREDELAAAWTAQVGGLAGFGTHMTHAATQTFRDIAQMCETYPFVEAHRSHVVETAVLAHEPVGVVAAIVPWNAPYANMSMKVAYALAAGCTVVMKPSPETPLEAYIIAEATEAAGLPAGVVNLVCGDRPASEHLVRNPDVDKVAFTGSTAAGKRIASICGERMARCTLELGGKSAAIVRDDFSIEDAAAILGNSVTLMSGQVCAMHSRAIVSRDRHDELAEAIKQVMEGIRIGHSDDPAAQLGPLAMKRQLERVEMYVEEGRKSGADLVTGGKRPSSMNKGYFMEPTLFANVDNRSRIAQEEIFGPVLCLIPAEDEEDAIRIANESHYGLNGSVLTNDVNAAYRIARRVRTGGLSQNGLKMDITFPFGGFKQSGIGREGGVKGLEAYLESKTILLDGVPDLAEA